LADSGLDKRRRRLRIVAGLSVAVVALLFVRYAVIMLSADDTGPPPPPVLLERGPILDRNGRILAIQTSLDTVTIWKPDLEDPEDTVRRLAEILDRDEAELRTRIATGSGFVIVERTVTPSTSRAILQAKDEGFLAGVHLQDDYGRSYPEREAAAQVIGYVGVDNVGLSGIEYMFTDELSPPVERSGDPIDSVELGNQVFLTIDLAIQHATDDIGERLLEEHDADSVMGVVMRADTAELLAVSSVPSFDPNSFSTYAAGERRNRVIAHIYEPGSVFKAFSVAAFLELGGIGVDDEYDTSGGYVSDGGAFVITDLADYGRVTPAEIIKYSSNVGAAYASERVSPGAFYDLLTRLGFGSQTGVDLNGEERGLLAQPTAWSARTRQTLAIGQEIGVTAIQIAAAATVLTNDGVLLRPQIVDRILGPDGQTLRAFGREPVREVISPLTARTMLRFMEGSTDPDGTARRIEVDGVTVAAKTGTAQVIDPETGAYSDEHFIASTLAIVPADDPQIIVYLVIDHPRGESVYGGRIAAPAVDELIEFLVPYLDIPRATDVVIPHSGTVVRTDPALPEMTDTVPDYRGLPKRTLVPLLARDDIVLRIDGSGWVVGQSPAPGSAFRRGMELVLTLQ
jgi:cell division protein FtsI (penicillin-binding protein 3)